ncbi:CoA pyrophosphatase [uncultured Zoogloea sp.]|jgi:8-oxo-dGTP pyrophosphatase MutT (NUDIX family)|uniref:CoA pyrophosphatase n=1 Tax=uncultured Zoogloea sp. TaxID=160237 RepID=UPI00263199E0|nr:CoA pyrophosphatase [uncultured Zoogloea sp.]
MSGLKSPPRFSADWLRHRFADDKGFDSPVEEGIPSGPLRPAAVLVPIVLRESEPTLLLTRRTDHLHHHPGQVSFPGGRVEAQDTSPIETALRETEEEISLARRHVELLGCLPQYRTGTGFDVTPVVGLVTPPFELSPDAFEVAEVFEVPLSFLLDEANHQLHRVEVRGKLREYYAMPYGDYFIWGATAGMIVSLYRFFHR